jgi:hypothetical protein
MSELPSDEPSIAAAGVDPGRRNAAAREARGAKAFAVTSASAPTPIPTRAGENQFLRVSHLKRSDPFIENLKAGAA